MSKEMREQIDRFKDFILKENINSSNNVFYHITPDVNLDNIRKRGLLKSEEGTSGEGVYLTDSLKEALIWKDILEYENYEENVARGVKDWFVIELFNLDKTKIYKGDIFEDDELYFTEYVYRDDIGLDKIKSIRKI